jgi:hypothetical protein
MKVQFNIQMAANISGETHRGHMHSFSARVYQCLQHYGLQRNDVL